MTAIQTQSLDGRKALAFANLASAAVQMLRLGRECWLRPSYSCACMLLAWMGCAGLQLSDYR